MTIRDRLRGLHKRRRKLVKRYGKRLVARLNREFARASLVPDEPWLDTSHFPWIPELESHWETIRKELDAALVHRDALPRLYDLQREQSRISGDDRWKSLLLYGWGLRSETGCRLAPETERLVRRIPGVQSAFFSILAPGAHIPEHRGFDKALLRFHLAMVVPSKREDCKLFLEGEPHYWTQGRSLVFDDTYLHEVRNDTNQDRIVLLLHFERPMNAWGRALHRAGLFLLRRTHFVKEGIRNHRAWEARFREQASDSP